MLIWFLWLVFSGFPRAPRDESRGEAEKPLNVNDKARIILSGLAFSLQADNASARV